MNLCFTFTRLYSGILAPYLAKDKRIFSAILCVNTDIKSVLIYLFYFLVFLGHKQLYGS